MAQLIASGVIMARAKVYRKSEDRWYVRLWWKGEDYRRFMFDERVPLKHPELAKIIADSINTDIKRKGKYFEPRQWFSPKAHELRFDNYAGKWLDTQEHLTSYDQIESYFRRWVIPFFGDGDLREVRKGHIKDFLRKLESHYSPKTAKNILGLLHKMFKDAFDDELLLRIPPFPTVSVPETELRYLTQEQVYGVIDNIPEHDQPIFRFGYFYAMRPGEVRALKWDAIDFEKKKVTLKRTFSGTLLQDFTKSKKIRHLPLMDEPLEILNAVRGIAGFVFRTVYGKPYRKQRLGELWRRAGGPIPLYNGMRHSRAMHLLENDWWDFAYVQKLLGHTTPEMTRRYAQASPEGIRKRFVAGLEHKKTDLSD
jgi:integrase